MPGWCLALALQTPLGCVDRYLWTHYVPGTEEVISTGILCVELDPPNRIAFTCRYECGENWQKVSKSGWHGRYVEIARHRKLGLIKFELEEFRYTGYAAEWKHDMMFSWNPGRNAYFNTSRYKYCSECIGIVRGHSSQM